MNKMPYLDRTLDEHVPELTQYLTKGMRVLDVGCGPGTITLCVAEAIAPGGATGIDPREDRIDKANSLGAEQGVANASFSVMDSHELEFEGGEFDLVYSHTVAGSLRDPVTAFREQKRVTKPEGWVVAAGVRDWGLVERFPPTPAWDRVYEAGRRFCEVLRAEGNEIAGFKGHFSGYQQAGRRCPGWFLEAGLTDLTVQVKPYRVQYSGSEHCKPSAIDLLAYPEDHEFGWYELQAEYYRVMSDRGFIDEATLQEAVEEAKAWYKDPRAFHFWAYVFVAGRA